MSVRSLPKLTENERLKDGLVRIIQCRTYRLAIECDDGWHMVDGYNASDVLTIIHEVFPDFSAWDEDRAMRGTP